MYVCVYLMNWLYYFLKKNYSALTTSSEGLRRVNLISRTKRRKIKCMFIQETGYLLRKVGEVDCTRRSFPVRRWMNKYMGLIIQIEQKDTYVFVMSIYVLKGSSGNGQMPVCLTGRIGGMFCISLLCQREKE